MSDIRALKTDSKPTEALPKRIARPCDYGLMAAVRDCETQVGTVEAFNKLCQHAAALKAKIDDGKAVAPHERWLTDPAWIYPRG